MGADSIVGGKNMVSTVLPHSDVPNLAWVCWLGSERLLRDRTCIRNGERERVGFFAWQWHEQRLSGWWGRAGLLEL